MAYIDEEGWFYADEETINAIDEQLAEGNEEFAKVLTTYVEARHALAKARIAQGFYPVVVPREPHLHDQHGGRLTDLKKGQEPHQFASGAAKLAT